MLYDVATAISQGQRDYQEDALVADFAVGVPYGFAVVADGMGGHAAGDVASKIVVTEVFSELKFHSADRVGLEENFHTTLLDVVQSANLSISEHVERHPDHRGMGTTVVAPVLFEDRLYWISIGDSPLYLCRKDQLTKLNADHSLAPQIDLMISNGQLDRETGLNHPDRNCLTSVLMGRDIPSIDCVQTPQRLQSGDIIIAASDGLQYLSDDQIEAVVAGHKRRTASEIARAIMRSIDLLGDPDQDNTSVVIIKCKGSGGSAAKH